MSEGKVDNTDSTEARSEEVRSEISRRHSVARALNMDNEMRRELRMNVDDNICQFEVMTYDRERGLLERALRPSNLILFWSSLLNFCIFPGLLAA
jgi:hypothetical protein